MDDLVKRVRYEADLASRQAMLLDDEGRDVSAQCLRDCAGKMREAADALSRRDEATVVVPENVQRWAKQRDLSCEDEARRFITMLAARREHGK